ncbi:MAG: cyclic nucleotide-binding domain-containing protein [Anaerolineae bacterium]|nr:cyclic nucleotide-binding domain-containing protein [Anaerolineae bacterium]
MTINPVDILQQAFPDLLNVQLAPLATLTRQRAFAAGELICREGAYGETFYIIDSGEVEFTKQFTDEEERQLRTGGPGVYFGEMALVQRSPRNANVRALTDVTVLEIDKSAFDEAIQANPEMMLNIMRTLIERMRNNDTTALDEMREQKEEIERAYEELRHQDKVRSEFLTSLAHELRTPLTAAGGYMQLLQKGLMQGPALAMGLEKVGANLDRIISLVNDLLFVQEIELIEPNLRPVDLPALLDTVIDEVRAKVDLHDCTVESVSDLPTIQADVDGLTRAFTELLENAAKFSPKGEEVTIALHGREGWVDVDFIDKGVGIAESFMPRLFTRFERTDRIGEFVFEGIGLGLAIAKHIIGSHGGSITVKSKEGEGSTFTVHLPIDGGRARLDNTIELSALDAAHDDHWLDATGGE